LPIDSIDRIFKDRALAERYYDRIGDSDDISYQREATRFLIKEARDLYFLFTRVCGRSDGRNDWVYTRAQEIREEPYGCLDLWFRGSYKSSLITFGLVLMDIIADSNKTHGIFSFKRPIATQFLRQIKREAETNPILPWAFDDVFWQNPDKQAPSWSEDNGLIFKRDSNPKEATVEAHGVVEGQPTSKHFDYKHYDDVVSRESVTNPEMIAKTTEAVRLSFNLGAKTCKDTFAGTRWHFQDAHKQLIDAGTYKPRVYPATDDDGNSVFLPQPELEKKRRDMGPMVYAAQMELDPTMDSTAGFLEEWLRYYEKLPPVSTMNFYILVDPANAKKKDSDWTVMWVIGAGQDENLYIVDVIRDRISLGGRTDKLIGLHRKWKSRGANILGVGYERYGKDADIEAIEGEMERQGYRFVITELGGRLSKTDRINRLEPKFSNGEIWIPRSLMYTQYDGLTVDIIHYFVEEEYKPYPAIAYKDALDALARIEDEDMNIIFPEPLPSSYRQNNHSADEGSWMV